jgi:hypothetical protein
MRPIKVGTIQNRIKKIKTEEASSSVSPIIGSPETYIDYTNFTDGNIMRFDAVRNCYYFSDPDSVLDDTLKNENKPEVFINKILDEIEPDINIDPGEY